MPPHLISTFSHSWIFPNLICFPQNHWTCRIIWKALLANLHGHEQQYQGLYVSLFCPKLQQRTRKSRREKERFPVPSKQNFRFLCLLIINTNHIEYALFFHVLLNPTPSPIVPLLAFNYTKSNFANSPLSSAFVRICFYNNLNNTKRHNALTKPSSLAL